MSADEELGLAATVVLMRDAAAGPEVLLLERPGRGSFPGAWVFPGGRVEPEDGPGDDGLLVAAIRETLEETGLKVSALVPLSRWDPPLTVPKRFRTSFFLAAAPDGPLTLQAEEAVAHAWLTPSEALTKHEAGGFILVPPTWVTLYLLRDVTSVADALARTAASEPEYFITRMLTGPEGQVSVWGDDAAHASGDLSLPGARHRLDLTTLPWIYTRTPD